MIKVTMKSKHMRLDLQTAFQITQKQMPNFHQNLDTTDFLYYIYACDGVSFLELFIIWRHVQ